MSAIKTPHLLDKSNGSPLTSYQWEKTHYGKA